MSQKEGLQKITDTIKNLLTTTKQAFIDYKKSYHKGVEKFGIWWKIFNFSMWAFIAIFLFTAIAAYVLFAR